MVHLVFQRPLVSRDVIRRTIVLIKFHFFLAPSTHACELEEGMNEPQYLSTPIINGEHTPKRPNINPGGDGVSFSSTQASIAIDIAPSITPIIEYVSIANKEITNVVRLTVAVITPDGPSDITLSSPKGDTTVVGFPTKPLPANSTLFITFETVDGKAPFGITLSIVGCFHPELTTTGASTSLAYSSTQSEF